MSASNLFFLSSCFLLAGLAFLALALGFKLYEFSLLGQRVKLRYPIEYSGINVFYIPTALCVLADAYCTYSGLTEQLNPAPARALIFKSLHTAELQASEIDDIIYVSINGRRVLSGRYGQAVEWIDVTSSMKRGPNAIEVITQNGRYGGCGARLELRLNGFVNQNHIWTWGTAAGDRTGRQPNTVCFQEVKTVNLD